MLPLDVRLFAWLEGGMTGLFSPSDMSGSRAVRERDMGVLGDAEAFSDRGEYGSGERSGRLYVRASSDSPKGCVRGMAGEDGEMDISSERDGDDG